jgi:hypothetical protein
LLSAKTPALPSDEKACYQVTERRTKGIAPIPQLISARAPDKTTHVPTPPLSGSSSIEALVPALSCTNKTLRLSAKTVPTANAL